MSTIRIPLNSRKHPGLYALIDEADYDLVSRYQWYPFVHKDTTYAKCTHEGKSVYMHRVITAAPSGMVVDHIDHDGLNNSRKNLRVVTQKENLLNRRGARRRPARYTGIEQQRSGRWTARIYGESGRIGLGTFDTAEEAARVRDKAIFERVGRLAHFNFPEEVLKDA